ncbi:MAG: hypothetical protein IJ092_08000 [Atopobiaceae bacterium]|nr:hypothetical protein [Atopobiaceae bacterium]
MKAVGSIVVMLIVGSFALGCSSGGSNGSKESSEPAAKQEQQVEPEAEAEKEPEPEPEPVNEEEAPAVDATLIRPEFKEAMDSYEAFFDEYVEVMKAYQDDPTNAELMMRMSDMMVQEADMLKKFDAWESDESMTTAETAYYLEVQSRIYAKLAEVM